MRVMTFNLRADNPMDINNRWYQREQLVYDVLKEYKCDIIGFQEVTKNMENGLTKKCTGYRKTGEGRTQHFFMEKNPLFIREEYGILQDKTFWLSKTPEKRSSSIWYSLFPRICTGVVCQMKDGKKVRIYNTHLDCLLPMAREYGLKVILNHIKVQQERETLPCILMGDFNAKPDSKLIKRFKNGQYTGKRFVAVQEISPDLYSKTTMSGFKGREEGRHIDYIFVTEEVKVKNIEIVRYNRNGKYPSDHYPIIADLEF